MALRKRLNKDDTGVFIFEDQQEVSETQEEDTTPADKVRATQPVVFGERCSD